MQYFTTISTEEDISSSPRGQNGLSRTGDAEKWYLPATTGQVSSQAQTGYGYPSTSVPITDIANPLNQNNQDNLYQTQQLGTDYSALHSDSETIPIQIPNLPLEREFLAFLMSNLPLLNSVRDSTSHVMASIQYDFERYIQQRGPVLPLTDIHKILQQFKPVVGSPAIRQESDARMTGEVKQQCPFQFCGGHFTRAAGLKNHLAAHFGLAPNQCSRCGRCFSDTAIKRHKGSCRPRNPDSHFNANLQI